MKLGQSAEVTRVFDQDVVARYAALTGDESGVRSKYVPEALVGGMFSELLGTKLPGRGTNWMKQRLKFVGVAPIGRPLTATVEVTRLRPEKDLVNLSTTCRDADGYVVCVGEALVMAREMLKG